MFCNRRWWASRIEYDTVPVQHVCALRSPHDNEVHTCACGATYHESLGTIRIDHHPDEDDANVQ
jgi:hypothetical protein